MDEGCEKLTINSTCKINSFQHSVSKHLMNTYYMPGAVLGVRDETRYVPREASREVTDINTTNHCCIKLTVCVKSCSKHATCINSFLFS